MDSPRDADLSFAVFIERLWNKMGFATISPEVKEKKPAPSHFMGKPGLLSRAKMPGPPVSQPEPQQAEAHKTLSPEDASFAKHISALVGRKKTATKLHEANWYPPRDPPAEDTTGRAVVASGKTEDIWFRGLLWETVEIIKRNFLGLTFKALASCLKYSRTPLYKLLEGLVGETEYARLEETYEKRTLGDFLHEVILKKESFISNLISIIQGAVLRILQPGDFFGERIFGQEQERVATAICVTNCTLLVVQKDNYNRVFKTAIDEGMKRKTGMISDVCPGIDKVFSKNHILNIIYSSKITELERGTSICKEGHPTTPLVTFILKGEVKIQKSFCNETFVNEYLRDAEITEAAFQLKKAAQVKVMTSLNQPMLFNLDGSLKSNFKHDPFQELLKEPPAQIENYGYVIRQVATKQKPNYTSQVKKLKSGGKLDPAVSKRSAFKDTITGYQNTLSELLLSNWIPINLTEPDLLRYPLKKCYDLGKVTAVKPVLVDCLFGLPRHLYTITAITDVELISIHPIDLVSLYPRWFVTDFIAEHLGLVQARCKRYYTQIMGDLTHLERTEQFLAKTEPAELMKGPSKTGFLHRFAEEKLQLDLDHAKQIQETAEKINFKDHPIHFSPQKKLISLMKAEEIAKAVHHSAQRDSQDKSENTTDILKAQEIQFKQGLVSKRAIESKGKNRSGPKLTAKRLAEAEPASAFPWKAKHFQFRSTSKSRVGSRLNKTATDLNSLSKTSFETLEPSERPKSYNINHTSRVNYTSGRSLALNNSLGPEQ